jgi:regulation of enolase protein 1 (concanavalin A-like superfamily)
MRTQRLHSTIQAATPHHQAQLASLCQLAAILPVNHSPPMKRILLPSLRGTCAAFTLAVTALAVTALAQTPLKFTSVDIGGVKEGSTMELVPGRDFEIRGYGTQFGLHVGSDQGRFVYTKLKGDFDITVKVRAVESEDQNFGEAGLMIRSSLKPEALMVGQFVSNNYFGEQDQYTFMFRTKEGGSIEPWGEVWIPDFWGPKSHGNPGFGYYGKGWAMERPRPRPFPYVWLRLIRTGNTYRGLLKEYLDSWVTLGSCTLELGDEVYVGLAISANHHTRKGRQPDGATNVSFRNLTIKQP